MPELTTEDLERIIGQAQRGDWIKEAYLQEFAADLIEKGEPLPLLLRTYIATSLRESAEPVNREVKEFALLVRQCVAVCLACFHNPISREMVADLAANTIYLLRQLPRKLRRGKRLPEELLDCESIVVQMMFLLEYRENGDDYEALRCSWQDAVAAVSERLGRLHLTGYSERSIASHLKRFKTRH